MVEGLVRVALVLLPLNAPLVARPQAPPVPRLVVLITVDQLSPDYLVRFRPQFTGGLERLLRNGAVFTGAYQDHAVTETAPGHATAGSGRNPWSTGIVRNDEGVPDSTAPLLESNGPGASPWRFRGTALFDWIANRYPSARALSMSYKDRSAILAIGRARQQVYWIPTVVAAGAAGCLAPEPSGRPGSRFSTSRYYADTLPEWVRRFNADAAVSERAPGYVWDLLLPPSSYPEPDSMPFENRGRNFTFPHRSSADTAGAVNFFAHSPWLDSLTLAFALLGVRELGLGRGPGPDLLAVGLSATDEIGHSYGPDSREVHDQILRLDRWLGMFLDSLDRAIGPGRIVVALTADHGVTAAPEFLRATGDTATGFARVDTLARRVQAELVARAGPGCWIRYAEVGLVAMDRPGLLQRGVNVDSVVEAMREAALRIPGVVRVDTRRTLAAVDTLSDTIGRRWRNSLPADALGELMITLRPHYQWGSPIGGGRHGQPTDDDTHVPLIIAGPGVTAGRYPGRVSVVDLAPTLARLLGVSP
ncbi:MAG: alkaline phosphatase family protein, partial [Gemmatimonadales bacterium]|nr:alkaline phosphatase family protein [Gemmatimonadales bacterium]